MRSASRFQFSRFFGDRRGNVAIMFTVAIIPVLGAIGTAVDYARATQVRAKLQAAADSAILLAVGRTEITSDARSARKKAEAFYAAQAALLGVPDSTIKIRVSDASTGRTATATFSAGVKTEFAKFVGLNTLDVAGVAKAAGPVATYIDFYLLLDNTPSMGVAATPSDVTKMVANTPDKCAFACHDTSDANNYYKLAKTLGVQTRIDVVRQATEKLMDTAAGTEIVSDQFRMAIYQFANSCGTSGPTTITPLTGSLSSAKTAASKIDLMTMPYQGYNNDQCTDFDGVATALNLAISAPGAGTVSAPQKYVFLVSDGVSDAYYPATCAKPTTNGRCQEPFKPVNCTLMKSRGIKVAVLYTTYLALPTNGWYNSWIDPFNKGPYGPSTNSEIAKNMEACASPGFFFEVSPTQGIAEAMDALFKKAVSQAHLTQ